MLNNLGTTTESAFLKEIQSHKLHQEFAVATGETVYKGMPVKLNATGEIVPAGAAEPQMNIIGYCVMDGAEETLVTVGMRGFGIVWATSSAAMTPGPVKYVGFDTVTGRNQHTSAAVTEDIQSGWALDVAAGAGEKVRVVIK
jgi:hypothetical protein